MHKTDFSGLSTNQLAELTGRTPRTIKERLRGVTPVGKDGRAVLYNPREALPLIYEIEKKKGDGTVLILQDEKARLASAQADKTEMQVRQMMRELLPSEEVERVWTQMALNFRAKILVLPAMLAPQLAGLKKPVECQELMKSSINQALDELSEYDAQQFRLDLGDEGDEEDGGPAESEGERVGGSRALSKP